MSGNQLLQSACQQVTLTAAACSLSVQQATVSSRTRVQGDWMTSKNNDSRYSDAGHERTGAGMLLT
jgi:hypothetical protein